MWSWCRNPHQQHRSTDIASIKQSPIIIVTTTDIVELITNVHDQKAYTNSILLPVYICTIIWPNTPIVKYHKNPIHTYVSKDSSTFWTDLLSTSIDIDV